MLPSMIKGLSFRKTTGRVHDAIDGKGEEVRLASTSASESSSPAYRTGGQLVAHHHRQRPFSRQTNRYYVAFEIRHDILQLSCSVVNPE